MSVRVFAYHGPDIYPFQVALKDHLDQCIPVEMRDIAVIRMEGNEVTEHDLEDEIASLPFGSDKKVIVIHEYLKIKFRKKLFELLAQCPEYCSLFLVTSDTNKIPSDVVQFFQGNKLGRLINNRTVSKQELGKRIVDFVSKNNLTIDAVAVERCAEYLMDEPELLKVELEKLALCVNPGEEIQVSDVDKLVAAVHTEDVFHLVGYIMLKKKKKACESLMAFLNGGGSMIFLQTLLYNEFFRLYQFLESRHLGDERAFKEAGVFYPEGKRKLKNYARMYNSQWLVHALNTLGELERVLKSETITNEDVGMVKINLLAKSLLLRFIA